MSGLEKESSTQVDFQSLHHFQPTCHPPVAKVAKAGKQSYLGLAMSLRAYCSRVDDYNLSGLRDGYLKFYRNKNLLM